MLSRLCNEIRQVTSSKLQNRHHWGVQFDNVQTQAITCAVCGDFLVTQHNSDYACVCLDIEHYNITAEKLAEEHHFWDVVAEAITPETTFTIQH